MSEWQHLVDLASECLAAAREKDAREMARERLPRPLRWVVRCPALLRALYRLWPQWRPVMTVVSPGMTCVRDSEGRSLVIRDSWYGPRGGE